MKDTTEIGNIAEEAVTKVLMRKGLRLVARNYSVPNCGELDVVMTRPSRLGVLRIHQGHPEQDECQRGVLFE